MTPAPRDWRSAKDREKQPKTAGWNGGKIHRPGPLETQDCRNEAMASFRKRGRVWYYRFVDADGVKREEKGCTDRRVTEELAREKESEVAKIRSGLIDPRDTGYRDHGGRPLAEHLRDW